MRAYAVCITAAAPNFACVLRVELAATAGVCNPPACLPAPSFNPPHLPSHSSRIPYIYATSAAFRVFRVCVAAWLMGVVCQTASWCSKRIANECPTIPAHFAALSTLLSGVIRSKPWCNADHPTFLPLSLLAGMRLVQAHTHSASHAARHLLHP